ncbi:MAG: hypothetical protein ABSC21_19055 [Terriglobia bacterium]|jgi:hypothetical protein
MAAFSKAEVKKFEDRMIVHLNKFFPEQCKSAGEKELRETVHYGIKSAGNYGIIAESDVCKYIDVMLSLGSHFDRDPQLPWAHEILTDDSVEDPAARIARLCDAVGHHGALQSPSED